jgi:hypothetical protein
VYSYTFCTITYTGQCKRGMRKNFVCGCKICFETLKTLSRFHVSKFSKSVHRASTFFYFKCSIWLSKVARSYRQKSVSISTSKLIYYCNFSPDFERSIKPKSLFLIPIYCTVYFWKHIAPISNFNAKHVENGKEKSHVH